MKRDLTVQPACRATLRSRNARVRPGASDDDASPRRSSLGNGGRILALVTRPHRPEERRYVPTDIVELRERSRLSEELTRERVRLANRMRDQLWRYYPQFLDAVDDDVAAPWALDLWQSLPTPRAGQRVREVTLTRVLKQHRIRRIDTATLRARLRAPEPAVEWFLLTSLDVDSTETAVAVIGYYLRRWRIEDLFRVLKSGCRVEHLAFHTADRLQRAVTINTVIAWRLMVMTLLGRDVPGCDAQLLFTDIELRFLTDYAEELGLPPPDHLAAAVLLLAILGGYQNRTHDPPPGHQIMWRGYERMSIATIGYRIGRRARAGVVQNE